MRTKWPLPGTTIWLWWSPDGTVDLHVQPSREWALRIDVPLARRIEAFLASADREQFYRFRSELFRTVPDGPGMALPAPWPRMQRVLDKWFPPEEAQSA
ncbi:MAG: hypothetical protein HY329_22235 [Chloroflexi bacterium]|nr:hypothetical protein [Chloroflexota bacterium]